MYMFVFFFYICICNFLIYSIWFRWLQPDRSVDPDASDIDITTPPEEMLVGKKLECIVRTRDQNGKIVFVEGMNVSTLYTYIYTMYV